MQKLGCPFSMDVAINWDFLQCGSIILTRSALLKSANFSADKGGLLDL